MVTDFAERTPSPLDAAYQTEYQARVHPERIVMLPGYALRLLAQGDLTPKDMSLWVGFRQAVYSDWSKQKTASAEKNIPYWEALRFAMMGQKSFYREVTGKDSFAGGLVTSIPDQTAPTGDPHFDYARRYRVQMFPFLTRKDAGAVQAQLAPAASEADALAILQDLASQSPSDFLNNPAAPAIESNLTVTDLVKRSLGAAQLSTALRRAAEVLQDQIINGFGKVFITHYFLREVVHTLGLSHAQAWTIIALRSMRWFDYQTKEAHPFAVLKNGLEEVAALTASTVKSVRNWLDDEAFALFVQAQDLSQIEVPGFFSFRTMVFQVEEMEPLVVESDEGQGKSDKRQGKKCVTTWKKLINDQGKSDKRLNRFIKVLKGSINHHHQSDSGNFETPLEEKPAAGGFEVSSPGEWNLLELAPLNTISARKMGEMKQAEVSGKAFATFLAEAFTKQNLNDPVGFAIKNALMYPHGNPRAVFARYSKDLILSNMAYYLARHPLPEAPDLEALFKRTFNLRELYFSLGGEESAIPATYVPPAPEQVSAPAPAPVPAWATERARNLLAGIRQ